MNYFSNKKKFMAYLVLLTFVFTCIVPTGTVFADATGINLQTEKQVVEDGNKYYYNASGNKVSASSLGQNGSVVALSKTLEATGQENIFDITLQVETTLKMEENITTTETNYYDSAVVLTIDKSGTMYRYTMDGERYINVAKAKALAFLEQYEKSAEKDEKRYLAIVTFDTDAWLELNWTDVNTDAGYTAAESAIKGITVADEGDTDSNQVCTNFDGGLMLTRNLLNDSSIDNIDNIDKAHSWAIVLSDGAPTVTSNDSATVGKITSTFWNGQGYQKAHYGGGWTHPEEVKNNLTYVEAISNKASVYMVGVGGDMEFELFRDAVYGTSNGTRTSDVKNKPNAFSGITPTISLDMTTADWLTALANSVGGSYISAANSTALENAFTSIMNAIKSSTISTTTTITSDAWNAADPIGGNATPCVEFLGFFGGSNSTTYTKGDTNLTKAADGDTASLSGNTINWDLKNSNYSQSGNVYKYSIKYRVRLANENTGFVEENSYVTNGTTTFEYQTVENNQFGAKKTVGFPIPQVKGYLGEFSFTKTDGDKALAGADFKLQHAATCGCGVTIDEIADDTNKSDAIHSFSNIPSGHSYTLVEIASPNAAKYEKTDKAYVVTVAYGVTTVTENGKEVYRSTNANNNMTVVNEPVLTTISGTKTWKDIADQSNRQKPALIVYQNSVADANKVTVTDSQITWNNDWTSYSISGLWKNDSNGNEITYIVREADMASYEATYTGNTGIVNTLTGNTSIEVSKVWKDNDNAYESRPASITYLLLRNGTQVDSKTVTSVDGWKAVFGNLDKYDANGAIYTYTVKEQVVEGYTSDAFANEQSVADGKVTITNTIAQDKVSISGTKTWIDPVDTEHPTIIINLLRDNVQIDSIELADGETAYSFTNLDKYDLEDGHAYAYTVEEEPVPGYRSVQQGDDFINTIEQSYFDIDGKKFWVDEAGETIAEPEVKSVQIQLFRDDVEYAVTTASAAEWVFAFTDLPRYAIDNGGDGHEYVYRVVEVPIDGYVPSYELQKGDAGEVLMTITNTRTDVQTVDITVAKEWIDNDNELGKRPESIIVNLYQSGTNEPYKTVSITENDDWTCSFIDLPRYNDAGEAYLYSVEEKEVPEYISLVVPTTEGFKITNTLYTGEAGQFVVSKKVTGDNAPAADEPFGFRLRVKAVVEEWDAVLVSQKMELEEAYEAAKEKRNEAVAEVSEKEEAFRKTAVTFTTESAYKFIMVDSDVSSPSALQYTIVDSYGRVFTEVSTASVYMWDGLTPVDDADSVIDRVIAAIKALASEFRSLFQRTVFMDALNDKMAENSTPSALGFYKDDAEALLFAERNLMDANDLVESTSASVYEFIQKEVTTPSAIKIILTPTEGSGLEAKEFELNPESACYDAETKSYTIGFDLFKDTGYIFKIEATTGTMIDYVVSEVVFPMEDYVGTEVSVNGGEPLKDLVRNTGERELNQETADSYLFTNIYEDNPPLVPNTPNTPNTPNIPDETIPDGDVPTGTVEIPGELLDELEDPEIPLGDAPATGDTNNAVPFVVLMLVAMAGLVITRRKFN